MSIFKKVFWGKWEKRGGFFAGESVCGSGESVCRSLASFCVSVVVFVSFFVLGSVSVFAVTAEGVWNFGAVGPAQNGATHFEFPAEGGEVTGGFSGSGYATDVKMGGDFTGTFTGGWDGVFSGEYSGSVDYTWVNPGTGAKTANSQPLSGTWTAKLGREGEGKGKLILTLNASNAPSTSMSASFDSAEFDAELAEAQKAEEESEKPFDEQEALLEKEFGGSAIGEFGSFSGVYVVVDGKKIDLEKSDDPFKDVQFRRGMTIGTYDENSWGEIELEDGSEITLSGEGSEISVITMADIDKELWKKTVGDLPRGTVITASPGQIVLKYKTGGKEGYLFPQGKEDKKKGVTTGVGNFEQKVEGAEDLTEMMYVIFSNPDSGADFSGVEDMIGNVAGLRDFGHKAPPLPEVEGEKDVVGDAINSAIDAVGNQFMGLLFSNHSEVSYDYDGENVEVKVLEGEVTIFKMDFNGKTEEVGKIPQGQSAKIAFADFVGDKKVAVMAGEFDLGYPLYYYFVGGGIMFVFIAILSYFGAKRVKAGKADTHWKDY
ncbi:MAG: hypothetical protein WC651_02055 [Candidatus Gracilibacteria bacterium]|jgi:hypothetical protein